METCARVLVTGGAGFIGSNICEKLLLEGHEVVCFDNLITGFKENITPFLQHDSFVFIEGDIRDVDALDSALINCTHVCHQAALGSVPRSVENPLITNDHNANGTLNVFWKAYQAGIKRVVYASSSSVYGDEPTLPKVEDRTGRPLSPYAVSKCISELYATVFTELYDMEMIGLRYFNVFGRRQSPEGEYAAVIPKFVKKLIDHESPQIFGDGEQSRDFTYIDNVVQVNINALMETVPDASGKIFNIAYGERVTINELFTLVKNYLSGFDCDISGIVATHVDSRMGDIKHSLADISAAREFLDYNPKYNIDEGMKDAIEWYWNDLK